MRKFLALAPAAVLMLGVAACDVEKTESGEAPSIDVDADAGALPEYDVDTPDVDVTTDTTTVEVPEVDVTTEEKQVEVPEINVEPADAG